MCKNSLFILLLIVLVVVVGNAWAAVDLKVDIGTNEREPNWVKPGWTGWSAPRDDPGPVRAEETFGDITVILDVNTFGFGDVGLAFRDPYDGPLLVGDGVMIDNFQNKPDRGEMYMTIVGLGAGDYTMTTWHNYTFDWPSEFVDITIDGELKVDDMSPTITVATDEEATTATFDFTAPGDANVVIMFRSEQPQRNIPLNAFHLVSHSAARDPDPADGGLGCPDVDLSWTAGVFAQVIDGHDVYFGTDYNDVDDANTTTSGIYIGSQSSTTYNPTGELTLGGTYYWRIDEVNDTELDSPLKGRVWTLNINDETAFNPYPGDEDDVIPIDSLLSWSGCVASTHKVYFSTDFDDVNDREAGALVATQSETSWDPNGMEYLTFYYWAVDEVEGMTTWSGPVWSFKTESSIVDPNMILWYEFNETGGDAVPDSSGYERHGTIDDIEGDTWDPNDGRYPGCINFNGGERIDGPWSTLNSVDNGITVSLWLKESMGDENYVFSFGDEAHNVWAQVPTSDLQNVEFRAGNDTNDLLLWREANPSAWVDEWHHFAFRKDQVAETMSIYFDGSRAKSKANTANTLDQVGNKWFQIGAEWDSSDGYSGKIDDFRIYDYALPDLEIEALARGGELGLAWAPNPLSGASDLRRNTTLSWKPGQYASSHDVYFGTSWDDVNDANTLVTLEVYKENWDVNDYNPGILELGTTYYWRIDEVNNSDVNSPWKGKVWQFTVASFLFIDDFESYVSYGTENPIHSTWQNDFDTGAWVELGFEPLPVHRGDQSMEYGYDSDYPDAEKYSENYRNYANAQNWEEADVKLLTLFFYGHPDNDANSTEQMYFGIQDSNGTESYSEVRYGDYGEDMNDIRLAEWTEWNMDLADFNATLTDVRKLFLGFGDREAPSAGGMGYVYFDDVRLYPPKCVPAFGPLYDFDGDCIVGLGEIAMLGDEWLLRDRVISPNTPPADPCVLHYRFDETSGTKIFDSVGPYDANFIEDVNQEPNDITAHMDPGMSGNSFHFSTDTDDVNEGGLWIPNEVFTDNGISQEITVAVWIKNAYTGEDPEGDTYMWDFRQWDGSDPNVGEQVLAVAVTENGDRYTLLDSSETVSYELPMDWEDHTEWTHYTFVRDVNYLKIYVNGYLEESSDSNGAAMATPGLMYLGISSDRVPFNAESEGLHDGFTGNMEDFMIFDYALNDAEAGHLGTIGTGYIPMPPATMELSYGEALGSRVINFKDYAELMLYWLDEQLWPE